MSIPASLVKELRKRTGVGMMDCKKALAEGGGNLEKAIEILRVKGKAKAVKKLGRITKEGAIFSYIHLNSKIGVLLELGCETDFVAKTDEFKDLGKNLAMQIAASSPLYLSEGDVPEEVVEREKEIYMNQAKTSGKPEQILEKMAEGRLRKYFEEVCLLEQPFIRDEKIKVQNLIQEVVAKLGENISITRFTRYEIG
ncbi:TPA: elongation factor Ts [bacterium]|nr:elongation factor Ts [bacterium]